MKERPERPDWPERPDCPNPISPAAAAANACLEAMRAQLGISPRPADVPAMPSTGAPAPADDWQLQNAIKLQDGRRVELARSRGHWRPWAADRASRVGPGEAKGGEDVKSYGNSPQSAPQAKNSCNGGLATADPVYTARIAPALASHCLDYDNGRLDAPYQLYEILRALDRAGQGDMPYAFARSTLCDRESPYYRYGRRRLIEVLKRGADIFWHVAKDDIGTLRIWLHSRGRVAATLGVRLGGHEAIMPLSDLIPKAEPRRKDGRKGNTRSRHAEANAALYAAWHAGREKPATRDPLVAAAALATSGKVPTVPAGPIARGKLRKAAGISKYRQRAYERRAGIRTKTNIRLTPIRPVDQMDQMDQLDKRPGESRGKPRPIVFPFTDYKGLHGPTGGQWYAKRLPNSYQSPERYRAVFSQRMQKINAEADRLRVSGNDTGTMPGVDTVGPQPFEPFDRVFFLGAKAAERHHAKSGRYVCWKSQERGRCGFYHSMGFTHEE